MSGLVRGQLDRREARMLTEKVKSAAEQLWRDLLALYEGQAHLALGYPSWAEYCRDEFDMGQRQAYRVLDAARVVEQVGQCPIGHSAPPRNEAVAREMVPVLRDAPERVAEVWADVVEMH